MNLLGYRAGRINSGPELQDLFFNNTPAFDALLYFQDSPEFGPRYEYVKEVGRPGIQVSNSLPGIQHFILYNFVQSLVPSITMV